MHYILHIRNIACSRYKAIIMKEEPIAAAERAFSWSAGGLPPLLLACSIRWCPHRHLDAAGYIRIIVSGSCGLQKEAEDGGKPPRNKAAASLRTPRRPAWLQDTGEGAYATKEKTLRHVS
jgi:hypothetical protein